VQEALAKTYRHWARVQRADGRRRHDAALPGVPETDATYEDPANGAVLVQVWQEEGDTIAAAYQPVTSGDTIPADPYPG
jgi:hypothetical protein